MWSCGHVVTLLMHCTKLAPQEEDQEAKANDVVIEDSKGNAIDTKGSAVMTIDAVGTIQSVNKAAYTMFGYSRFVDES
jgi:PAS domain-containing protein